MSSYGTSTWRKRRRKVSRNQTTLWVACYIAWQLVTENNFMIDRLWCLNASWIGGGHKSCQCFCQEVILYWFAVGKPLHELNCPSNELDVTFSVGIHPPMASHVILATPNTKTAQIEMLIALDALYTPKCQVVILLEIKNVRVFTVQQYSHQLWCFEVVKSWLYLSDHDLNKPK